MLTFIIVLVVMGLVIGLLARLLLPGRDPLSMPATLAVGVVATLISGFIGRAFFGADGRFGSWLFALVIAIVILLLIRRFATRTGSRPTM
jgi:uncharacterized membrane protein YeaQ/YmgE (transglycosylase-associated protein family)